MQKPTVRIFECTVQYIDRGSSEHRCYILLWGGNLGAGGGLGSDKMRFVHAWLMLAVSESYMYYSIFDL